MPSSFLSRIAEALGGKRAEGTPAPRTINDFLGGLASDAAEYTGDTRKGAPPPIAPRTGAEFGLMEAPPPELPDVEPAPRNPPTLRTAGRGADEDKKGGWDALDF